MMFENSPWFILLCFIVGFLFAFFLYQKKGPWSIKVHYGLFVLRFLLAFFLCFLLIGPIIRQILNTPEKPILVVAVDNSTSIPEVVDNNDLSAFFGNFESTLNNLSKYQVYVKTLNSDLGPVVFNNIVFDQESSDIANLLKGIQSDYEGRNLAGVILISDGIYNRGVSPTFSPYTFDIFTLGLGDTIQRKDLSIKSVVYNKISYQGNKFPVVVEILNKGFSKRSLSVNVVKNGTILDTKKLLLSESKALEKVEFLIEAEDVGMQRYKIELSGFENEHSYKNNSKQVYVDVVEGREKILLVASSPHPDIKAIASAIESNENYQLTLYIPGIHEWNISQLEKEKYDLVIFHQVPDLRNTLRSVYETVNQKEISTLTIVGPSTNLKDFNKSNNLVSLKNLRYENDQVLPFFNNTFPHFSLSEELQALFEELPPATVPFGKIEILNESKPLLYQKVGRVETFNPLLVINEEQVARRGVMLGIGTWRWRLHEFLKYESNEYYNEFITKIVQFLSSKEDKRKFRIYPLESTFSTGTGVSFETEFYNDLFERVYGPKVELKLIDDQNRITQYSFVPTEGNTKYRINQLTEGVYKYSATTELNNKNHVVNGELLVKKLELENINLTADFGLLRKLSDNNNGLFFKPDELNALELKLHSREHPTILHSSESYLPLVNLKILFFVLLLIVSVEWFVRKLSGTY